MLSHTLWWMLLNLLSIFLLAFYSMLEMACVSFNKVRLQYYVAKGNRRAQWLDWLLKNPSKLFGTTLIGVNLATFFGSEFARESYSALGLDPDFSSITQVILVVIFGELAPMFAARRFAEQVALMGVPIVYASAKLLTPFLWIIELITFLFARLLGRKENETNIFLTQDELQKILEEQDETRLGAENEDFNAVTSNIFKLSHRTVSQVMKPLSSFPKMPSNATIAQAANLIKKLGTDYLIIYHRQIHNIIGIAYVQDLVKASENKRLQDFAKTPWFVTRTTTVMQLLHQFRSNQENLGIILDQQGKAEGVVHLFDILKEIFGTLPLEKSKQRVSQNQIPFIEKTLPGATTVADFKARFGIELSPQEELTLAELMMITLGHQPEIGESIYIEPCELSIESLTVLEIKTIKVLTKRH